MSLRSWLAEQFRAPTLGEKGELAAARYLKRLGYKIVATRRRLRYGEIDIVAVDDKTVVFAEVKTRRSDEGIHPADAVDHIRRARMTRAATAFLKSHNLLEYPARFDIIEVIWPTEAERPTIRHHQNAFAAEGSGQFHR